MSDIRSRETSRDRDKSGGPVEDAIRAIIREELSRTALSSPVSPPSAPGSATQTPSRREAVVLLVTVVNVGLILLLLPRIEGPIEQFLGVFTALGSSVCALGYLWWRERLEKVLTSHRFLSIDIALLALLMSTHLGRNIELAPVLTDPPDAIVVVDGIPLRRDDGTRLRRLTLRNHTVQVAPQEHWAKAGARGDEPFQMNALSFVRSIFTGPTRHALMCDLALGVNENDAPATLDIRKCDPSITSRCDTRSFDQRHLEQLSRIIGFRTLHDDVGFELFAEQVTQLSLPVGSYEITASKTGCDTAVTRWTVDAKSCGTLTLGPICQS